MQLKTYLKTFLILFLAIFSFCGTYLWAEGAPWKLVTETSKMPFFGNLTPSDKKEIQESIECSLEYLNRKSSKLNFPKQGITHQRVTQSLKHFYKLLELDIDGAEFDQRVKEEFDVYQSVGTPERKGVLFTGYFEPLYKGSRTKKGAFKYPLYRKPPDLVLDAKGKVLGRKTPDGKLVNRYWTRQEIDQQGVLSNQGLELVYLDNIYDAYMAQFQGSVAIELEGEPLCHLGYHARNCSTVGFSLAKEVLTDKKWTKKEVLPANLEKYFYKYPAELPFYLRRNPSYIFFTEKKKGPTGALSVVVKKERSISTDSRLFPKAALAFVDLSLYKNKKNHPFRHFVLNQDTGGVIMGPGRCEIFYGTGDEAYAKAADMLSVGQLYFLFLKDKPS